MGLRWRIGWFRWDIATGRVRQGWDCSVFYSLVRCLSGVTWGLGGKALVGGMIEGIRVTLGSLFGLWGEEVVMMRHWR
jgi:hypothetical protein